MIDLAQRAASSGETRHPDGLSSLPTISVSQARQGELDGHSA
ncbi:hypothetical protein [Aidingimonas lacisalsi]|nr:hypothetical protein [Aidingimonas lacisalsi]